MGIIVSYTATESRERRMSCDIRVHADTAEL